MAWPDKSTVAARETFASSAISRVQRRNLPVTLYTTDPSTFAQGITRICENSGLRGATETEVGSVGALPQPEHAGVEVDGRVDVVDVDRDMVQSDSFHRDDATSRVTGVSPPPVSVRDGRRGVLREQRRGGERSRSGKSESNPAE